jgi:hypothetical protein
MRTYIRLTSQTNTPIIVDPNAIIVYDKSNPTGLTALHLQSGLSINVKETVEFIMAKINTVARDTQSNVMSVGIK